MFLQCFALIDDVRYFLHKRTVCIHLSIPQGSEDVIYDNKYVRNVFNRVEFSQLSASVWPSRVQKSNFRMAIPNPQEGITLHAEDQLLADDGLEKMIDAFIINSNPKKCPEYIILFSWLTPCKEICSKKIVEASKKLQMRSDCPGTPFYLYVQKPEKTYSNVYFNHCRNILLAPGTGIKWLNDPGPRI